jgi:hypothetical protein
LVRARSRGAAATRDDSSTHCANSEDCCKEETAHLHLRDAVAVDLLKLLVL